MDSTASAFSVLPIIGYALLAILLAYLGIRGYRYLKSRTQTSVSLPKPVSGGSHKSTFALGRSTGWNWRRWTLPRVPSWSKVPKVVIGKAKAVAHSKNLSVELLPTTGLPPPPTAVPTPIASVSMPTPQLVDLTTPATPPLTTGTTSNSYPASPRTPTPPFMPYISKSKPIYPTPPHASYPRPPSPHGLFATTSQKPHRRSRSLGGVPVRRLSGGTSGLRNAVELKDLSGNHARGTSREHLLIDFNSSSSSDEDKESIMKISPAASDIGILPSGKGLMPLVDPRMVGRHVPLVDLGDDTQFSSQVENAEEDSWRWFTPRVNSNAPPLLAGRLGPKNSRPKPSLATPQVEKLVDVDGESDPEPVLGSNPIQAQRLEVRIRHYEEQLIDVHPRKDKVNIKEATLVDVHDYSFDRDISPPPSQVQLVDIEDHGALEQSHIWPQPFPVQTPVAIKATFPHPLESLIRTEIPPAIQKPFLQSPTIAVEAENSAVAEQPSLLFEHADKDHELRGSHSDSGPLIEFNDISETSTKGADPVESASPLIIPVEGLENQTLSQGGWAWDLPDHSDPWASHITDISTPDSDVFVYTGMDAVQREEQDQDILTSHETSSPSASDFNSQVAPVFEHESEVLEKSPSASLFPTELADEEEGGMTSLDLEDVMEKPKPQHVDSNLHEHTSLDEEQDLTPKPTPASLELELPVMSSEEISAVDIPSAVLEGHAHEDVELSDDYPDPELLPLPESPLLLTIDIPDPETPSLAFEKDEPVEKAVPRQTPTPPASPPPISPLRFVNSSFGSESLHLSPKGASKGMSHLRLPPSPQLAVLTGHSPRALSIALVNDTEDKENATPTALSVRSPKPIVAQKVDAILSTDVDASESPRVRRRVLGDVSADVDVDLNQDKTVKSDEVVQNEMTSPPDSSEPEVTEEAVQHVVEVKLSSESDESSLPGSFPDSKPSVDVSAPISSGVKADAPATSTTIGARLAMTSNALTPRPSARAIVRSPFDIALAMQLRPGLGAGADPAWMVRFLMAMFGWLAVVVSGQAEF